MIMVRRLFWLIIGWSTLPATGLAQDFVWTPGLQRAYADLLKLKVQPARQQLSTEPGRNGIRIYADDYADMLTLLFSDDEKAYANMADREAGRLDQLNDLDEHSPWSRVTQAEVRLHWAFVKLKFGEEVSACWDVIKAYKLLSENQKLFPDFLPTYKTLGVLHVMIGAAPDKYTWVATLLGLRGNVALGVQEIRRAQQDPTCRLEAQLIELMIRAYVLQFSGTDAVALRTLVQEQPDNALLNFLAAAIQMKNGQSESARHYLLNRPGSSNSPLSPYLSIPIVDNMLGDIYLQKGQFSTAITYYQRFLNQYKGQNFLKDTYYKQFLCYWLNNQLNPKTRALLQRVETVGRTTVESDKAAQKFAGSFLKRGPSPNQRVLMQARLSCDGGYLDSAFAYLRPHVENRFTGVAERAEFNYRMGRIQQRRSEADAAVPYFTRAIVLCAQNDETDKLSFGATAALQLGYVYQQKKDSKRARQYFQKALSYKHHEYKNSIDNKARAGLNSLQ